ncbi:MAG: FtsW/RodA/SpoVE family cell cycle protein, partial [Thermoplasmata archaeon]|nr:FtsW/RodA/SpoVE family cell cycle protein [Thermoplasmata archaeon]NIT77157.1 FtsW/RodA/SpoVE family cell cycle protein [Thermoplasmata archaeon]NIU49992.1 FtsW/RodA/SpoVE family cell cycle protein [Thermoplasmata archaeon]NIV78625.1 FtsW/RodA/SpoVE family cell cycle protein [Thermoplasmata archaeon]NIW83502.1 FtsW/RodA/SpoVE family cell cycle protein [Thermoplasmata archaeon]
AVTVSVLVFIMMFVAGVRLGHLGGLVLCMLPLLYLVVTNFAYMMNRIAAFIDPWKDPDGLGFQMVQSFLAFGSGGV